MKNTKQFGSDDNYSDFNSNTGRDTDQEFVPFFGPIKYKHYEQLLLLHYRQLYKEATKINKNKI